MKVARRKWLVSAVVLGTLVQAAPVLAQDGEQGHLLGNVTAKLLVMADHLLDYWVTGNVLTDPRGLEFVGALASIVQYVVLFMAQMSLLW